MLKLGALITGSKAGYEDGRFDKARFSDEAGMFWCFLPDGNLAVCDDNRIRMVDFKQKRVSTLAGCGEEDWLDGPADKAKFNSPQGLAADEKGNLYVSEF